MKRIVIKLVMYVAAVAALVFAVFFLTRESPPTLAVHFLDIGQGDATLIRTPEGATVLIDAGPDNMILHALGNVMPWYDSTIEYAIITHADLDHYGGFFSVLEHYTVSEVWVSSVVGKDAYFESLLTIMREKQISFRFVKPHDLITWPSGVRLEVLWPPADESAPATNARSVVTALSWREREFLLTGDMGVAEERQLLDDPAAVADVLKIGHHGSKTSSAPSFVAHVRPRYCIISAGVDNRYGHPHATVMATLKQAGCRILETAKAGTISFFHSFQGTLIRTSSK